MSLTLQDIKSEEQVVTCSFCTKGYTLAEGTKSIQRGPDTEYQLVCPHCKVISHLFFMTPELERRRQAMDRKVEKLRELGLDERFPAMQAEKAQYRKMFDRMNNVLRKRHKVKRRIAFGEGEKGERDDAGTQQTGEFDGNAEVGRDGGSREAVGA